MFQKLIFFKTYLVKLRANDFEILNVTIHFILRNNAAVIET